LGARGLLTTIRRSERALLIDEYCALSNDHVIGDGDPGPLAKRLSERYTVLAAKEDAQVVGD